jgi:hypothetical protein
MALALTAQAATIEVNPGDDLDAEIESAQGGDIIRISPGTYGPINLSNIRHSSSDYVLIENAGTGAVIVRNESISGGSALEMNNCSYFVFSNIRFEGGMWGMFIYQSDHLIFSSCEITATGQEGIHIFDGSSYVDILGCRIWDTGHFNSQWGECIYLGSASNKSWWPDYTHHIWIENSEMYECGNSEGVNMKGEVDASTVRNCRIHDLAPGTASQYNEGAVSLETTTAPDITRRDNFVENCEIYNIQSGRFPRGIAFFGIGNTIRNNTIRDCASIGLYGNSYENRGFTTYLYNNTISGCNPDVQIAGELNVSESDRANPYSPQSWYGSVHIRNERNIGSGHGTLSSGAGVGLSIQFPTLSNQGQTFDHLPAVFLILKRSDGAFRYFTMQGKNIDGEFLSPQR